MKEAACGGVFYPFHPTQQVDGEAYKLAKLVSDMTETMEDVDGAGLAAPQIGVSQRVFTYRIGEVEGHIINPVLESSAERGDATRFRAAHGIAGEELVLTVLPGSRGGEVSRLLPIFGAALRRLEATLGPFRVAVPTVETVAERVTAGVRDWPGGPVVLRGAAAKYDAFTASRAALAASGTVALELALAGVPMVIAYRLNPLTEALLDRLLHVRRYSLVNLLLDQPVVPELVRGDCNPERIAAELGTLIRDERVRSAHRGV